MFASFETAHPILGFAFGLQSASLLFLFHPERHLDGFSEQMISAITETSLEHIKPIKAFNDSSRLDEIRAVHINFCVFAFGLP